MVLVSNEWKNNSNDDDKSTATATSTAEPSSPPAAATASEAETKSYSTSTTTTTTTTTTIISASLSKSVNGACMSTEPRETLKAATIAPFEDTNVKALTPLIEDIEIGTATLTTRVVCENNPTHEFSEKAKHFYEDLKDKEKKEEAATITKATLDCFSSWHEASFVGKNYVKMAEPLKEPFDDEHYADKILEGDSFLKTTADTNNSFDMLLDREANFDSNSNTLLASNSCQMTSRSKSPANVESVQNVVRPMLSVSGGVTSLTAQIPPTRKLFNTNFSIGDNHTSKNDNNLSDVSTKTSCSDITTSTTNASAEPSTGQAKIVLLCETNSHPFQRRTIFLTPNVECMVGRLIAKSKAGENNAIFDCKVLSRKHAVIWYTPDGKFWVKDTKSSNGTFINDHKLGEAEAELHFDDIVKFGVDVLENSRKEVHGCVIACVKLYLPDGREAISIDAPGPYRGQYSGEDRISYDELNRLNLYIQETASREKLLTSKLCNIQSVLDATRKNSALCWQAMITEDQLLHRIHSLEKKLQLMEKNIPENALRNEVLKLMDDKSSYQLKTKEALRKMYQERNDAMQMFSKMESAYTESNNECSLLRDQIANSTQVLQDVNSRLMQLENEYSGYREESMRQQHEAKEREEQRIGELNEQLRKREVECDDLKRKLSAMCIEVLTAKQQQLENQAIEKLDAAIADVCLGDEEDINEDDEPDKGDVGCSGGEQEQHIEGVSDAVSIESTKLDVKPPIKLVKAKKTKHSPTIKEKSPPKPIKEATIMKWLQNSDINKKEGSVNIFKAICNENDSNSEDSSAGDEFAEEDVGRNTAKSTIAIDDEEDKEVHEHDVINMKCINFANKLKTVQKYLKQLEAEIENDTTRVKIGESDAQVDNKCDDLERGGNIVDGTVNELLPKQRNDNSKKVLSKNSKSYLLLTSSVNMLREAYNEITTSVALNEEKESEGLVENAPEPVVENDTLEKTYSQAPFTSANNSHVADQTLSLHNDRDHLLYMENGSNIGNTHNDGVSNCEVNKNTINIPLSLDAGTTFEMTHSESEPSLQQQLKEYQTQVEALSEKLERTELEAQQTLEIMQYECEETKKRVQDLTKAVQSLSEDKQALEKVITENNVNNAKTAADTAVDSKKTSTTPTSSLQHPSLIKDTTCTDVYYELNDTVNDDISQHSHLIQEIDNEPEFEREEELITYKERLEKQEQQNIQLRYEIDALKLKTNQLLGVGGGLVRTVIPCGAVALALFIYFLNTYF